ncbi:MAG: GNAT family N-acetyltransferase [Planctomycetaceae bacterium]
MVEYRTFHNCDPPKVLKLWHASSLGASAAEGFPCDILELFVFSQPYFDRRGFFVAMDDDRMIGFAHAAFAPNDSETALDRTRGVISSIVVHPDFRRRGVGTELVRRAEDYLRGHGSSTVTAGAGLDQNGFYTGIYGGLQPSGFGLTSAAWSEFFFKLGYSAGRGTVVLHRDLMIGRDPVSSRLIRHRRRLNLVITDRVGDLSWWWQVRFGQLDALKFQLQERHDRSVVARGQIVGLDVYVPKWGVRAVGIRDVFVPEEHRRNRYGLSLVLEICRRLREQSVQLIEAQIDQHNDAALELFRAAMFDQVQELVTFQRTLEAI